MDGIPNADGQEIAKAEDSMDTQSNVTDNTGQTNRDLSDSNQPSSGVDTKKNDDSDTAKAILDEARAAKADLQRREFELDKRSVQAEANSNNFDYLLSLEDSRADKVVKSLTQGKFKSRQDLIDFTKREESFKDVKDEGTLTVLKQLEEQNRLLNEKLSNLEKHQIQDTDKRVQDYIYEKYPNLSPSEDTGDKNWNKFRSEWDLLKIDDPYIRAEKAYKLAFGDTDEDLARSLGNLPSGGGASSSGSKKSISQAGMALAKELGISGDDIKNFS